MPAAVEDCQRTVDQLAVHIGILEREAATGADHRDRIADQHRRKKEAEELLKQLNGRWTEELRLVSRIREIRNRLAAVQPRPAAAETRSTDASNGKSAPPTAAETKKSDAPNAKPAAPAPLPLSPEQCAELQSELVGLEDQLKQLQGEEPLVHVCVDSQAVAEVVSGWTGIPAGRMVRDEIKSVLELRERMEERIVGQSHALEALAQRIRTARANLTDPRKPLGVFLLVGSSGVGKTETAITLADLLYGGEQNMTVINMSEFKEEHKVSLLMGSPPGYVGYGEGGVLTEAVRRRPYSVVLLDEMEKAHSGVQDIFYQVFDKGSMRDGEGRDIDFKNTVILMTSNAGTDTIVKLCADPETRPDPATLAETLRPDLLKIFKPAFLGRVTVVPYFPLSDQVLRGIVELQLGRIVRRIRENYQAELKYSPQVVDAILGRCREVDSGARNVEHILSGTMLPEMAKEFLACLAEGKPITRAQVDVDAAGNFVYVVS